MAVVIISIGAVILVVGVVLMINPGGFIDNLQSNLQHAWLHVVAVVVRIVLGLLLISQAGLSRFPLIIEILGWISLAAAALLLLIGRENFQRFVSRVISLVTPYARAGGAVTAAFGAFLVYAFL